MYLHAILCAITLALTPAVASEDLQSIVEEEVQSIEELFRDEETIKNSIFGAIGICKEAANCTEAKFDSLRWKDRARYTAHVAEHGHFYNNGTFDEEKMIAYERSSLTATLDDMCTLFAEMESECLQSCPPPEDSVFNLLIKPVHEFACVERKDDVLSLAVCIRELTLPHGNQEELEQMMRGEGNGSCAAPQRLLEQWLSTMTKSVATGASLKQLGDMLLGEQGPLAALCQTNECYTEEIQAFLTKSCGDGVNAQVLDDFQGLLGPKVAAIVEQLHLDCLVPDGCKDKFPIAAIAKIIMMMT